MARGKIQIRRIENQTNRQVTYSKRRNGLFKKANELSVLCDAKVSIITVSSTNKLHEFISPSNTTKQLCDLYQKNVGVDLWNSHYEKMQQQLKKLQEVNRNLRMDVRHRMGDSLDDLNFEQLRCLADDMEGSVQVIRERKYKVITNQIDTRRKKLRNVEEIYRNLLLEYDARQEDPQYGLVDNEGDQYNAAAAAAVLGFQAGVSPSVALIQLQPNHHHNRHSGGTGGGSDITTFSLME